MLRAARSIVRTDALAEEVVQETWLAVLRGIGRFEGRSSLRTWVFRILKNRARTLARRESRTLPLSELTLPTGDGSTLGESAGVEWLVRPERTGALGWHGVPLGQLDPHEQMVNAERQLQIEKAIRALPPRQREIITLRDLEGWSAEEVCKALELTEGNQRVLLHRARMKVREAVFAVA